MKIKQLGEFKTIQHIIQIPKKKRVEKVKTVYFDEGDILKITIEAEGTKNIYIGKFLYFSLKKKPFWNQDIRKIIVLRHHTLCSEGIFSIELDDIINIEVIKECNEK